MGQIHPLCPVCVRVCTPLMCVMTDNDREMSDYQPKHYTQQAPSPLCVRLQLMFVVAHVSVCVCEEVNL